MIVLNQHQMPSPWKLFQLLVGGTIDKRRLCLTHYRNQSRVLEVGCSVGNIAKAFLRFPIHCYVGVDIDPVVIRHAQRAFAFHSNFKFICQPLSDMVRESRLCYDYILFAGVCHHVDDLTCIQMLQDAMRCLSNGGIVVIVDPLWPRDDDNWFIRRFIYLDLGQFIRNDESMLAMLAQVQGLGVVSTTIKYVGATPLSVPKCTRFGVYLLERETSEAQ